MWMITTNDRTLGANVYQWSGLSKESLTLTEKGYLGAVAFAAGGEVLRIKQPLSAGDRVEHLVGPKIRSHRLITTVVQDASASFRPENVQPYCFRGWVLAIEGDPVPVIPPSEDPVIQGFVARNRRGTCASELLAIHIFARAVQTGLLRLREPNPDALYAVVEEVMAPLYSKTFDAYTLFLSSEEYGIVVTHNRPVSYRTLRYVREAPHLRASLVVDQKVTGKGWAQLDHEDVLVVPRVPPIRVFSPKAADEKA